MVSDKDLKRRVRARMEKTGESYTTARVHILRKKQPPIPDNCAELAGMSDDTVVAKTGRTWPEWVRTLDALGAVDMPHGEIAAWVRSETGLGWWSQAVTVGYERIRGLRDIGQRRGGGYEASKSRTFNVPAADLFAAVVDDDRRVLWLDTPVTIRRATPHRTVRMTWPDDTSVEVYFTGKGPAKASLHVQHGKLPSKQAADEAKAFWNERLEALRDLLA
jgi:uncharacterized protein YndB with AHSA1/START domain